VDPCHDEREVWMSKETITAFSKHMEGDDELQVRLQGRIVEATAEAIARFAGEHGFEFTGEEFSEAMDKEIEELSEDELDAVAGGLNLNQPTSPILRAAAGGLCGWGAMRAGRLGAQSLPNMKKGFNR
jgi:predicted ribosomally synthesized peptide with nif11-like leader